MDISLQHGIGCMSLEPTAGTGCIVLPSTKTAQIWLVHLQNTMLIRGEYYGKLHMQHQTLKEILPNWSTFLIRSSIPYRLHYELPSSVLCTLVYLSGVSRCCISTCYISNPPNRSPIPHRSINIQGDSAGTTTRIIPQVI